jgi:hypothetical protein
MKMSVAGIAEKPRIPIEPGKSKTVNAYAARGGRPAQRLCPFAVCLLDAVGSFFRQIDPAQQPRLEPPGPCRGFLVFGVKQDASKPAQRFLRLVRRTHFAISAGFVFTATHNREPE